MNTALSSAALNTPSPATDSAPDAAEPSALAVPASMAGAPQNQPSEPEEELILSARRKITLRCGQSSITLHPNGKIVLRGQYILSAAEGTNRMVGGQIEIN